MKILALETSTEFCSLALWLDGEITGKFVAVGQKHSEVLMEMLDELLKENGLQLAALDGIAFGRGPGSFTGVRIACGVTQGLALGAGLPVAGINSLLAVAEGSGKKKVIVALDARMSEVYFAVYEKLGESWIARHEPGLCLPDEMPPLVGSDWFGAGSGFIAHGDALRNRYAGQLVGVDAQCVPRAEAVARLAVPVFTSCKGEDPATAVPLYLRDRVALKTAEREALQGHG